MGPNYDGGLGLSSNSCNDGALLPRMVKSLGSNKVLDVSSLDQVIEPFKYPFGRLLAVIRVVVSCVEAAQLLQVSQHAIPIQMLYKRLGSETVQTLVRVVDCIIRSCIQGAQIFSRSDVHEP